MANIITEDMIEKAAVELLVSEYQYNRLDCYTEKSEALPDGTGRADKKQVVLPEILFSKLCELNPQVPKEVVAGAAEGLCRNLHGDLLADNFSRYQKIRYGEKVSFKKDGKETFEILKLIDFDEPLNNDFTAATQMWIKGEIHWRRPDLILFVNGLPLVFVELKNSNVPVKNAYDNNLKNYLRDIPWLFNYNQICVLSNGMETQLGSFSADYEYFFGWLKIEDEKENPDRDAIKSEKISLEYCIRGLFKKEVLIDYIENFILFDNRGNGNIPAKIIAMNNQFFGVNNAYAKFLKRDELQGKLGVFWHTQGTGKSYSMIMLAQKIKRKLPGNFTFVIVTDREDLDRQIYKNFLRAGFMSTEEKVQPTSGLSLREELKTNKSILFTLIHKFRYDKGKKYPVLSERDDIIVFVDEAHRTQYKELAENMRKGLPNAQYLAFTATPLLGSKRLTNQWFGDYVSEYNYADANKDKVTVPLYYVKRVPEVVLQNDFFESDFADILENENLTDTEQQRIENHFAKEYEVLKRDDRLDTVARHIVSHFPYRGFRGKGMVISVDKMTAVKMYDKVSYYWKEEIKHLNAKISKTADEKEKQSLKDIVDYMRRIEMAVIVSEDAEEEEKFRKVGLSITAHRKRMNMPDEHGADIEDNFKDPHHPLSLVFVCAMWLTGFDVPSASTLYLDKPMKDHALMQTINRVNRRYSENGLNKENGIIVDFLDVFKHLKRALVDYAPDDDGANPVKDIEELLEQLEDAIFMTKMFCERYNIDLSRVIAEDGTFKKIELFSDFANIILGNDEVRGEFRVLANAVENLYESLRPDIFKMDFDPRYKNAILYLRDVIDGTIRPEKLEAAREHIDKLLDQSVLVTDDAHGFIIDVKGKEIDIFKMDVSELRAKLQKRKNKNLVIADLRKYIEKQLEMMMRRNVTRTNFADRFRNIIDEYNAGGSQNDDFYEKILEFIEELKKEEERHIEEELSEPELELFDLLRKDKLTKAEEKKVKLAAKELYKTLCDMRKELFIVDWQNDPKPQERVKKTIIDSLHQNLPDSYDREIFTLKSSIVFNHIMDQAKTGYAWVA